ncbi:Hypothetical predicted protein [Octopus vulgaris]|uniref:Uncharacterized protein n=1 Tax=Octopus vulgaris TaxID=6645 RepID=A0AA36F7T5_OCTVU|nr:Hypothetical predicted protein [Octopus vulgaris]
MKAKILLILHVTGKNFEDIQQILLRCSSHIVRVSMNESKIKSERTFRVQQLGNSPRVQSLF